MHADMTPFAPFSQANPLLAAVPLGTLHLACIAAGFLGLTILALRRLVGSNTGTASSARRSSAPRL